MLLYHGSNVEVREPRLNCSKRALDFGNGFYLTSDFQQARRWSQTVLRRRGGDAAIVSVFELDDDWRDKVDWFKFDCANGEWLDFVAQNRRHSYGGKKYDLVIGPVANDGTIEVLNKYMIGMYPKSIAIQLLLPQNLSDQYAFLSERALRFLEFKRSELA